MDNSGDTAGALATWRNWARRRRIDPFVAGGRCRYSCHQPIDWKTSSLTLDGLWPLAFEESDR